MTRAITITLALVAVGVVFAGRATATTPAEDGLDAAQARAEARELLGDENADKSAESDPDRGGAASGIPSGVLWILIAVAAAIGVIGALRVARGTVLEAEETRAAVRSPTADEPGALEQAATAAERQGDFARAIRLWFQAGLLRLAATGALTLGPSLTARRAIREVASPSFAELARSYESIVFAAQPASAGDAEAARRGWSAVMGEVRVR